MKINTDLKENLKQAKEPATGTGCIVLIFCVMAIALPRSGCSCVEQKNLQENLTQEDLREYKEYYHRKQYKEQQDRWKRPLTRQSIPANIIVAMLDGLFPEPPHPTKTQWREYLEKRRWAEEHRKKQMERQEEMMRLLKAL